MDADFQYLLSLVIWKMSNMIFQSVFYPQIKPGTNLSY